MLNQMFEETLIVCSSLTYKALHLQLSFASLNYIPVGQSRHLFILRVLEPQSKFQPSSFSIATTVFNFLIQQKLPRHVVHLQELIFTLYSPSEGKNPAVVFILNVALQKFKSTCLYNLVECFELLPCTCLYFSLCSIFTCCSEIQNL